MSSPHAEPRAGFTLAELLAVVVLVGILAAIVGPRFDLSRFRSDAGAQRAWSVMLAAQRAAVAQQHDVVVAFDALESRLRIHYDTDGDGRIGNGERVRYESLGDGAVFGRGGAAAHPRIGAAEISFQRRQDGLPAVTFGRAGSASEEGGFYVTSVRARDEGGRPSASRALVVDRATGRISVARPYGSGWETRF